MFQDRLFYVSKINKVSTISVFHCCFFTSVTLMNTSLLSCLQQ